MERLPFGSTLDPDSERARGTIEQHFWAVRSTAIDILQDRAYTLAGRLIILGLFSQRLQQYADAGRLAETPQLIRSYLALAANGGMRSELRQIHSVQQFQVRRARDRRYLGFIAPLIRPLIRSAPGTGRRSPTIIKFSCPSMSIFWRTTS